MREPGPQDVTKLLVKWSQGDSAALDALIPLVYSELRRLARHYLQQEKPNHTLSSTALVHEAYLRLVKQTDVSWQNRAHFFGVASRMMRRILVDHARKRAYAKRGGGALTLTVDASLPAPQREVDLVALDDALEGLAKLDQRQSRMVELRFFGGLSIEETSEVLGVSTPTVKRDWASARAWLFREISRGTA
ncbi:MAG TPA: sigma-70 family RNA polymerase sigma factor [Bryobacteraceae bacterium]|nr:sigma-70 family RNA polymerase sigma factor [Bryobacteraceae bacterium]